MINKVKTAVLNHGLISKGSTVVVALSGGSDSMALLNVLNMLKTDFDICLRAAHVNHCLRGNDADSDEAFVRAKCREMNVALDVLRVDVAAEAPHLIFQCRRGVLQPADTGIGAAPDQIVLHQPDAPR